MWDKSAGTLYQGPLSQRSPMDSAGIGASIVSREVQMASRMWRRRLWNEVPHRAGERLLLVIRADPFRKRHWIVHNFCRPEVDADFPLG